ETDGTNEHRRANRLAAGRSGAPSRRNAALAPPGREGGRRLDYRRSRARDGPALTQRDGHSDEAGVYRRRSTTEAAPERAVARSFVCGLRASRLGLRGRPTASSASVSQSLRGLSKSVRRRNYEIAVLNGPHVSHRNRTTMTRTISALALVWALAQTPGPGPQAYATGAPGERATWTNGNKQGVGTAIAPISKV